MRKFSFEKIYPKAVVAVTVLAAGIVFFRNMFPPLENAIVLDSFSSAVSDTSFPENVSSAAENGEISQISESASGTRTRAPDSSSENSENSGEPENSELININTADISELITLDGIGEARAKAIIEYREANGGFKSVDELTKVSGIGEKTLEKNRSRITV